MAGGAAVIGALRAAALLEAPIRVIGVVPTTENMPGGRALKPGDVIRGASGTTVEVINTDAEGRLVLGDGLWQARQLGATHLVDVATLTGACVVALGRVMAGVFGGPTVVHRERACRRRAHRRSVLADADRRRLLRTAQERGRRHDQHRRPPRRRGDRGAVPEAVRRGAALGAPGYRRCGVGRRRTALPGEGRYWRGHAVAGRARARTANGGCKLEPWRPPRPSSSASSVRRPTKSPSATSSSTRWD